MPVSRESGRTRLPPPRTSSAAASFSSCRIVSLLSLALPCLLLTTTVNATTSTEGASSGRGDFVHHTNSGRGRQNRGTRSSASSASAADIPRSSAKYHLPGGRVPIRGVPSTITPRVITNTGLVSRSRPGDSRGVHARGRVRRSRVAPAPRLLNYAPRNSTANSTDTDSEFGTDIVTESNDDNNNTTTTNNTNSSVEDPGVVVEEEEEDVPMVDSDDQTMVVTGEITIVSGDTVMTMSGIDMVVTVAEMPMDADDDYVDTMPDDGTGELIGDDVVTDDDVNDIPIVMDEDSDDDNNATTNSTDYTFDDVLDQVESDSDVNMNDGNNTTVDTTPSVDDTNAVISSGGGTISITFDMCQNAGGGQSQPRRALVRALPALKRSSGANIFMSDACTCRVTGTEEQVRAAEKGLRKFVA